MTFISPSTKKYSTYRNNKLPIAFIPITVYYEFMNQKQFLSHIETTFKDALALVERKNKDYAEESNPFANFQFAQLLNMTVEEAILLRVVDKIARISNLTQKGEDQRAVADESIADTVQDIINYLAIMLAYREDEKTKNS